MNEILETPASRQALSLAEELRPALLRINRVLRRQTGAYALSPLQADVLGMIQKHPGIGVSDLARRLGVRGPTMSAYVAQLEETGFLLREAPDPEDRRRVGLAVTEQGREAAAAVRKLRTEWLARQIDNLEPPAIESLRNAIAALSALGAES